MSSVRRRVAETTPLTTKDGGLEDVVGRHFFAAPPAGPLIDEYATATRPGWTLYHLLDRWS